MTTTPTKTHAPPVRGSSGAVFQFSTDGRSVWKLGTGNGRTYAQGAWLAEHAAPGLPAVRASWPDADGYEMERLADPPHERFVHHSLVLRGVLDTLARDVWSRPAVRVVDHTLLGAKLAAVAAFCDQSHGGAATDEYARLAALRMTIDWNDLRACLTHGDPTYDNVMFRPPDGGLVLVDPLPATAAVPDLRCVDVGKVLQSVVGWESARYGVGYGLHVTPVELRAALGLAANEWRASVFWCVVHLLRTLPYVHADRRPGVMRCAGRAYRLVTP